MPLYTSIVSYQGDTYISQDRRSNFKGFVTAWTTGLPEGALKALTPTLAKELSQAACRGDFLPVAGRRNVWRKSFLLGGREFTVVAVQTES